MHNTFKDVSQHLLVWAEGNYEKPRNYRSLDGDLNAGPSKYRAMLSGI
jgi:hypothetical protein